MVETPQSGFTGTVWDAVPADELARELTTGPGPGPTADTAAAYTALAARLTGAALEYRAVLSVIGEVWGSHTSRDGLAQLTRLADWLDTMTTAAQRNAATAIRQAGAFEIAKLAMPHLTEVTEALHAVEDPLRGSLLGAPLAGFFDLAERRLDRLREQAAHVMRTYEAASEDIAEPWTPDAAPEVSAGAALLAEQAPANIAAPGPADPALSQGSPALRLPPPIDLSSVAGIAAPVPVTPVGTESLVLTPVLPPLPAFVPNTPVIPAATAAQVLPPPVPAVPPATVTPGDERPAAPRALSQSAGDLGEQIVVDAEFATAPAVLGNTAAARPPVDHPKEVTRG